MDCVKKFDDSMSVGFTVDGKIVFDKQKEIIKNLDNYYGAYTGMFGIMKNGELCEWGKELESTRNNMYSNTSGRTVLGFDSLNNQIVIISIPGTTGKTGVRGSELYSICKKHGCTDALCNDGGGSVFLIKDGETIIGSERAVKNAIIVYRRKKKVVEETTSAVEPKKEEVIGYKEGMYKVGSDIPAGEYVLFADKSENGYYERDEDSGGDSIIDNDNFSTFTYVNLKESCSW